MATRPPQVRQLSGVSRDGSPGSPGPSSESGSSETGSAMIVAARTDSGAAWAPKTGKTCSPSTGVGGDAGVGARWRGRCNVAAPAVAADGRAAAPDGRAAPAGGSEETPGSPPADSAGRVEVAAGTLASTFGSVVSTHRLPSQESGWPGFSESGYQLSLELPVTKRAYSADAVVAENIGAELGTLRALDHPAPLPGLNPVA
jgi:hypothetical protein